MSFRQISLPVPSTMATCSTSCLSVLERRPGAAWPGPSSVVQSASRSSHAVGGRVVPGGCRGPRQSAWRPSAGHLTSACLPARQEQPVGRGQDSSEVHGVNHRLRPGHRVGLEGRRLDPAPAPLPTGVCPRGLHQQAPLPTANRPASPGRSVAAAGKNRRRPLSDGGLPSHRDSRPETYRLVGETLRRQLDHRVHRPAHPVPGRTAASRDAPAQPSLFTGGTVLPPSAQAVLQTTRQNVATTPQQIVRNLIAVTSHFPSHILRTHP